MSCPHEDCKQNKSESHQKWEELTKNYRIICSKYLEQIYVRVINKQATFNDLNEAGNLLILAHDLEQQSKVFDDTIKHTRVNFARLKSHHEREKNEHNSRTGMGFILDGSDEDLEEYYEDELE